MSLYKVNCEIWRNNIYLLPTIQIITRSAVYAVYGPKCKSLAIEFHWLVFNARLLFLEREE